MLADHLGYWARVLCELLPDRPTRLTTTLFGALVLAERLVDTVLPAVTAEVPGVTIEPDDARTQGAGRVRGAAVSDGELASSLT